MDKCRKWMTLKRVTVTQSLLLHDAAVSRSVWGVCYEALDVSLSKTAPGADLLVVVVNIQMRALKIEVERNLIWTAVGHISVDSKSQGCSTRRLCFVSWQWLSSILNLKKTRSSGYLWWLSWRRDNSTWLIFRSRTDDDVVPPPSPSMCYFKTSRCVHSKRSCACRHRAYMLKHTSGFEGPENIFWFALMIQNCSWIREWKKWNTHQICNVNR